MAGDHVQPLVEPELHAVGEEQLHADADSQEWAPLGDDSQDRIDEAGLLQVVHAVAEGAYSGQHDLVSREYNLRIRGNDGLCADLLESFLHGAQVAHAIVYDRDHILSPLSLRSR